MAGGRRKAVDERFYLSKAKGGGILRREIWIDGQGRVVRYNLAYINPLIFSADHGCVLGYDSAHGQRHRHYKGRVSSTGAASFKEIEARFQKEWTRIVKEEAHEKK